MLDQWFLTEVGTRVSLLLFQALISMLIEKNNTNIKSLHFAKLHQECNTLKKSVINNIIRKISQH